MLDIYEPSLQLVIMSWATLITLLLILNNVNADKSVLLSAMFKSCQNYSQKQKQKNEEAMKIPIQNTANPNLKSVIPQSSQVAPYQYSDYILANENYRMVDGILDICPLEFIKGQLINVQIIFQISQDNSNSKTVYRTISFYPQQNQCHSIDLFTLDQIAVISRTKIQLKLKSSCQSPQVPNKMIKMKIFFESFSYSQNLVIYQTIDNIFKYIIIIISIAIIFIIFQQYLPCYSLHQQSRQLISINHFQTMMPSFIILKQQSEQPQCAICLRSNNMQEWRITPCKHIFHKDCIDLWGIKRLSCPLCRGSLSDNTYSAVSTVDS